MFHMFVHEEFVKFYDKDNSVEEIVQQVQNQTWTQNGQNVHKIFDQSEGFEWS